MGAVKTRLPWGDPGWTTHDLKQRLGAAMSPRWLYIKCPNPAVHLAIGAASGALFPSIAPPPRRVLKDPGYTIVS